MWNPFREKAIVEIDYKPQLSSLNEVGQINLLEQFKGEVEQIEIKFPTDLGEEHPFDFTQLEGLYKKFGLFTSVVDKYVDFVIGPGFYIECKDARAKTIIEEFMQDVNFDTILRQWAKEALVKGNGFLEIGGSKKEGVKGLKVLNANYMYVKRDKKGKVEEYNQYKGAFAKFDKQKTINFSVDQIAHVPFNIVGDCAYGIGIGYSAMPLVDNFLRMQRDQHWLMERKANSPLQAKLGKVDGDIKIIPKKEDIDAYGKKMELMSKKTNWATDDLVELKVVDFGNIGGKFDSILKHDLEMLFYAFQIPAVVMGMANINEGIARAQVDVFQRRIQSIQAELEKIIEEKIFKRVLQANGLDVHVEFEWGTPSMLQVEARMKLISDMMKSATITGAMNIMLEEEMINLLKLDKDEWEKLRLEQEQKEEEERKRLETQPQPIVPGQNKGFPQKPQPKAEQPKQPKPEEMLAGFIEVIKKQEEMRNEYLIKQQEMTKEELKAKREEDMIFLKSIIDQMAKNKEEKINQEIPIKKEEVPVVKSKVHKLKKMAYKRQGLLQPFKITRKTESVDTDIEEKHVEEYIKKVGNEYCVFSHQTGKKFGCYPTKAQAEKRLAQIKGFGKEKLVVKIKRTEEQENYEHKKECAHCTEGFDDINDVSEWLGFNYKKYLGHIIAALAVYDFDYIKAVNEIELEAGYLTLEQIEITRKILDNGFKKGLGMKEMAMQVDKKVGLKDLYRMTAEGDIKLGISGLPILSKSADKRGIGIVRSEVTRMANQGAVDYYKENDIKRIKHIASFGNRTCQECESLNGTIYEIGQEPGLPIHPMCRCCYSPVVELK